MVSPASPSESSCLPFPVVRRHLPRVSRENREYNDTHCSRFHFARDRNPRRTRDARLPGRIGAREATECRRDRSLYSGEMTRGGCRDFGTRRYSRSRSDIPARSVPKCEPTIRGYAHFRFEVFPLSSFVVLRRLRGQNSPFGDRVKLRKVRPVVRPPAHRSRPSSAKKFVHPRSSSFASGDLYSENLRYEW